jgi:hypothetical protein
VRPTFFDSQAKYGFAASKLISFAGMCRIESVEPTGAACRLRVVCAVDYRLRRIPDMDASPHGVTN